MAKKTLTKENEPISFWGAIFGAFFFLVGGLFVWMFSRDVLYLKVPWPQAIGMLGFGIMGIAMGVMGLIASLFPNDPLDLDVRRLQFTENKKYQKIAPFFCVGLVVCMLFEYVLSQTRFTQWSFFVDNIFLLSMSPMFLIAVIVIVISPKSIKSPETRGRGLHARGFIFWGCMALIMAFVFIVSIFSLKDFVRDVISGPQVVITAVKLDSGDRCGIEGDLIVCRRLLNLMEYPNETFYVTCGSFLASGLKNLKRRNNDTYLGPFRMKIYRHTRTVLEAQANDGGVYFKKT